jgi:hypothetical protein
MQNLCELFLSYDFNKQLEKSIDVTYKSVFECLVDSSYFLDAEVVEVPDVQQKKY